MNRRLVHLMCVALSLSPLVTLLPYNQSGSSVVRGDIYLPSRAVASGPCMTVAVFQPGTNISAVYSDLDLNHASLHPALIRLTAAMEGGLGGVSRLSYNLSLPSLHGSDSSKRRLLLIYVHGFMGSEASFRDLPAHLHDLLTAMLSESHVVFTRIYPRYKSHGELQTAVEQFSSWLSPHEADDLDIILLGHSLGGIVAADVALLQRTDGQPKHRILGLVNFDVPFLGLHPRVIPTGVMSSMPKKDVHTPMEAESPEQQGPLAMDPPWKPAVPSPNFDPPFRNDVRLPNRGFLRGMKHFVDKNTNNLSRSIFNRLVSPMKFAGCVNNYSELRERYRRLKALEASEYSPSRVRFVNFYTASTGRPKAEKKKVQNESEDGKGDDETTTPPAPDPSDASEQCKEANSVVSESDLVTMDEKNETPASSELIPSAVDSNANSEMCPHPTEIPNAGSTTSLDQTEGSILTGSGSLSTEDSAASTGNPDRKLRKFILLPSYHWKQDRNQHWTPIVMEDIDEVEAHQSMFIPEGANYDHLIGESVALIEQWVQSDLSRRLLEDLD